MAIYTVVGVWIDDQPEVTGVIEGKHAVAGGEDGSYQPWATSVEAADVPEAERRAVLEMRDEDEEND